jgi:hypothetical protein
MQSCTSSEMNSQKRVKLTKINDEEIPQAKAEYLATADCLDFFVQ